MDRAPKSVLWQNKLAKMAALVRRANVDDEQDVARVRVLLDYIGAQEDTGSPTVSPMASTSQSGSTLHVCCEFLCTVESSDKKGENEVLTLTRDCDLQEVKAQVQQAFSLEGGVLITLPHDYLFNEEEQLVRTTVHLRRALDDFCFGQSSRRVLKVVRATLPISRYLVDREFSGDDGGEEETILALHQLSELAQLPGNVKIIDRVGQLAPLIESIGHLVRSGRSPKAATVACNVVWMLAMSGGEDLRRRLTNANLLKDLSGLLSCAAAAVETPERRKAREKEAESNSWTDVDSGDPGEFAASSCPFGAEGDKPDETGERAEESFEKIELEAGPELDQLTVSCLGAITALLHSEEAKEGFAQPRSRGLRVLLELSTASHGRGGVDDDRVQCMAAEALTLVLNGHGGCRMAWTQQGHFLTLLGLMRSPIPRVVLCGASILNGFLRGEPSQVVIAPSEASRVLEEAAPACQRCLDELGPHLTKGLSMDANAVEFIGILEQATAACWGSLAVIDRCPPNRNIKPVSPSCWLQPMLRVANLTGNALVSRWVSYCAVAAVGFCVGGGADGRKEAMTEVSGLPLQMLSLMKRRNAMELQEHAARALCNILMDSGSVRRKAVEDGFLDKLQRLLMGRFGSAKLDSTIACSIMLLCQGEDDHSNGDGSLGSPPKGWGEKQLISLVWALSHKNQDVLEYTTSTVWLLARRPEYRALLGQLWAIDGLIDGLRSNARLQLKEGLLAATWLLACHPGNTARLAMKGGLQVLVGMLHFPCAECYVGLKTLAVGALCQVCSVEPDVATLAMHLNLAPALLRAVISDVSTVYLKVLAAGLVFSLCRNNEHTDHRADYLKQFTAEGGPFFLEEMCATMLESETSEVQACGAFCAASLSLGTRSRQRLLQNGAVKALCRLTRAAGTRKPLRLRILHALLNLSTESDCQAAICRWALQSLVDVTAHGGPTHSEFASSILVNCVDNPSCRSAMFQEQLARGSQNVVYVRAAKECASAIPSSLWAHQRILGSESNRVARERFSAWVQGIKGGPCKREPRQSVGISPLSSYPGGHGTGRKADMMAAVRQGIRRPVSSLWEAETQRSSTAPARVCTRGAGENAAVRVGSPVRIRPRSRAGTTNGFRETLSSTHEGIRSADVDGKSLVGGQGMSVRIPGRKDLLKDDGFGALLAPACGSAEAMADGTCERRATPMPLRSSHRVGPVGTLGSTPLSCGEYRWKPFVSDCYTKRNPLPAWRQQQDATSKLPKSADKLRRPSPARARKPSRREPTKEEREILFNQAVKERQTVVVVEPPLNYKMVFDGPTNMGPARSSVNTTSMALFPHAPGASVCASLYEHYVAEDGLSYHLYHTGRVVCEVLDPGGYPPLCAPTELRHVLKTALPGPPPPAYPSGKKDAKPVLYLPPQRPSPRINAHYVPLCEIACRQMHQDKCPGARCRMFGAMPADFLVFEVGEEPSVEQETDDEDIVPPSSQNKWDVNNSIFGPRRKEADSRSLWDTDRVIKKALDADYDRMLKEDRVLRLVAKADAAVGRGEKTVKDSLEEVKNAIAASYKALLSVFNFYCLTPSPSVRGAFSIQPNQFGKMMQDADLAGNSISVEEIGKIFVMVNFESDKGSADAGVNEDRALMRFELIEALLRVAITMRDNDGEDDVAPADKLRSIIEEGLLKNLPSEATEESDTFRDQYLYTEACDTVLQEHQKALATVYQKYSLLDPVAGKPCVGLEEWKVFTNDARLIGDNGHMLRIGLRESKIPFYRARMMFSDEIKSRGKMMQLTFVDFLEALARLARSLPMPSVAEMERLKVTDIMDYEVAAGHDGESLSVDHNNMDVALEGTIASRLDKLIRFIVGTLAVRSNGVLKAGNKGINLVGLYCTKEHVARGALP